MLAATCFQAFCQLQGFGIIFPVLTKKFYSLEAVSLYGRLGGFAFPDLIWWLFLLGVYGCGNPSICLK
jgi:hypothetical protein